MRHVSIQLLVLIALSLSISPGKLLAEPLPPATREGACNFGSIVIARYSGYRNNVNSNSIGYFDPPLATFQILEQRKGPTLPATVEVSFDFQDGSACIEPPDWSFSESMMPEVGSRWLLFVKPNGRGQYTTYRGNTGRIPAGEQATKFLAECR